MSAIIRGKIREERICCAISSCVRLVCYRFGASLHGTRVSYSSCHRRSDVRQTKGIKANPRRIRNDLFVALPEKSGLGRFDRQHMHVSITMKATTATMNTKSMLKVSGLFVGGYN